MNVVSTIADLRREIANIRRAGRRLAIVPTMGNLHAGHLRLVQEAKRLADAVVVSGYVNPLQFGANEDFASYPRTPDADRRMLEAETADVLFLPTDAEMYPRGSDKQTLVEVPGLSDILCGAFRPGHFRGVITAVNRLFNLVQPDVAVFGKKDYQQLRLIQLMVADLGMPIEIVGVETVRAADGLALSSRNGYLRPEERRIAPRLYATLCALRDQMQREGAIPWDAEGRALDALQDAGFRPEYLGIVRREDLGVPHPRERQLAILAAVWLGRTRLIDNVEVDIA
jgi:pantoate--beta-alanine ligase